MERGRHNVINKTMAIVKVNYTRKEGSAKATIRYMQHRAGKDKAKVTRTLFGSDGLMGRWEAYRMIDSAEKGSLFFRIILSPDPKQEDTSKDLFLREITEHTMQSLEARVHQPISWVAVEHNDHTANRHVHLVAVVAGRLNPQDIQALRQAATEAACEQRRQ